MVKFFVACFTICAASAAPVLPGQILPVARSAAAKRVVAAAKEEAVLLREGSCTSGFTLSGFTETRLNGDYIAVYGYPNNTQQRTYHNDRRDEEWNAYPYGIRITSHPTGTEHYIPVKSWSIYYGIYQVWDVLLAWCEPGVGGCPEVPETGLWPSSVDVITWNVVVDPNLNPDPYGGPPSPPDKTTLNSGVSASCCEWTADKCADECADSCDQKIPLEAACAWSPFSSDSCREDCCAWVEVSSELPWDYHECQNNGGTSAGYRHCDHSSGLITEASAAAISSSNSSVGSAPDRLCASVNGNGGNWAVTLSFVSEAWLTYLDEINDPNALIDLNCFAGASSGSAVTMVVMNLLSNPSFVTQPGQPITHGQARLVARALGVLAMNADLQNGEAVAHVVKLLLEKNFADWGEGAWAKSGTPLKIGDIMSAFGRNMVLARHMTTDFVDLMVEDSIKERSGTLSRERVLAVTAAANFITVSDVPKLYRAGGMEGLDDVMKEQLESAVHDVRRTIESYGQSLLDSMGVEPFQFQRNGVLVESTSIAKSYRWKQTGVDALIETGVWDDFDSPLAGDLVDRFYVMVLAEHLGDELIDVDFWEEADSDQEVLDSPSGLDVVLEEAPVDGIITMCWVQERSDTDLGAVGISYDQSRIMAMMSRRTAEKILASQRYQDAINECRQGDRRAFMCRYIIAVVEKQRPMFAFAVQEPQNSKPYAPYLRDSDIVAAFDPLAWDSGFDLSSTRGDDGFNPRILVLGGYVNRAQFSMLQECYAEEGFRIPAPAWIYFGKVIEPTFVRDLVEGLLSPNPAEAEANWDDYSAWKYSSASPIFIDGKVDWDCGAKVPAFANGQSWKLRLHGASLARVDRKQALDDKSPLQPFAFDLMSYCEAAALNPDASGSDLFV